MPSTHHRPHGRAALLVPLLLALIAGAPRPAAAQHIIKPWTPPNADSLLMMATEARVSFRANRGDSVLGPNLHAYGIVQQMATRLLASLGPNQLMQSHAVENVLDSLGLDTSVALDPSEPKFMVLMVNNPYQPSAQAIGFLFWYRGNELRSQGTVYRGGREPRLRVWWTGDANQPYRCAIVETTRGDTLEWGCTVLQMSTTGDSWQALQWPTHGPDLSDAREVLFADIQRDGQPELTVWRHAEPESLFKFCSTCPMLLTEQLYANREPGFTLEDSRLMPSPLSTWVLFIRLLRSGQNAGAARLLENPAKLNAAIANGWAKGTKRGLWSLEYAEADPWPHWLALRFNSAAGTPLYVMHFVQRDARRQIHDWLKEQEPAKPGAAKADTTHAAPKPKTTAKPATPKPPAKPATSAKPGTKP